MTDLERFLLTTLKQILDLHKVVRIPPCECEQCRLARQGVLAAEAELLKRASYPSLPGMGGRG